MAKEPTDTARDILKCSFCRKSEREVKRLIAGPTVWICNECIYICLDILEEDEKEPGSAAIVELRRNAEEQIRNARLHLTRTNFGLAIESLEGAESTLVEAWRLVKRVADQPGKPARPRRKGPRNVRGADVTKP